jgi:hypothetical protein
LEFDMASERPALQKQLLGIATAGDALWFANNADRRIRIRPAAAMEFNENLGQAPVGMRWFALVLEAQPGARMRQAIALPLDFDSSALDDSSLFSLFQQAAPPEAKKLLERLRSTKLQTFP